MKDIKAKIIDNRKVSGAYYRMTLDAPYIARNAKPGQFVEVRVSGGVEPLLRRPFSVHRVRSSEFGVRSVSVEVLYEVIGKGTEILSRKKTGESVDVLGPLGNGFSQPSAISHQPSAILVAGGIGVAPLVFLAEELAKKKIKTTVLIGAKTKNLILCEKDFKNIGAEVRIATDDGSRGYKGFVDKLFNRQLSTVNRQPSTIYACGPQPMLKCIAGMCRERGIECEVSLEEVMACGIGACLGCAVKVKGGGHKLVCKDGPVFNVTFLAFSLIARNVTSRKEKMGVKIGRLMLKNPVMVASGTFGYGKEFEGLVDLKKLGAIVTKTVTLKPRQGNPMPRVCETASGMLNAIGLENEGVENFIDDKLPYLARLGVPVIVSISGDNIEEFCKLAKILDKEKDVDGLELNISCPNIKVHSSQLTVHRLVAQDKDATYEVVKKVRKVTKKALITKLSPNVTDIVEIAKAACKGGSDAVSLVNTFLGMAIDIKTGKPRLGNITGGLSGPAIKPIALRMVWEVAGNISKPVIGMGGIMTAEDAIEFLLAGAKAVQIGTANFVEPGVSEKIIKGIERWTKIKS